MSANLPSPTVRMLHCVAWLVNASPTVKGILAIMSLHVSSQGLVYLRRQKIARMAGYTTRAVTSALHEAERDGYIETVDAGGGRSRPRCYRVVLLERYAEAIAVSRAWEPQRQGVKGESGSLFSDETGECGSKKSERGSPPYKEEPILTEGMESAHADSIPTRSKKAELNACNRALSIWLHTILLPAYPIHRQKNISGALRCLYQHQPDDAARAAMMVQLAKWKASEEWGRDDGQYVADVAYFLSAPKYASDPPGYQAPNSERPRTGKEVWG
jgi:hypothetical protein